jgi:hypothetical protein
MQESKTVQRLKRIRDELDDVIRAETQNGQAESEWRRWFRRAGGVLHDVVEAGGSVNQTQWREIGNRHDYDPRGLGGFYTGDEPSMVRDPTSDSRSITERGREDAARWERLFGGKE